MYNKLQSFLLSLLLMGCFATNGQILEPPQEVYQLLLDNPRFIRVVQAQPELFCNDRIFYDRQTIWDPDSLVFMGQLLLLSDTTGSCPGLVMRMKKSWLGGYKVSAFIKKQLPQENEGDCLRYVSASIYAVAYKWFGSWRLRRVKVEGGAGLMYVL